MFKTKKKSTTFITAEVNCKHKFRDTRKGCQVHNDLARVQLCIQQAKATMSLLFPTKGPNVTKLNNHGLFDLSFNPNTEPKAQQNLLENMISLTKFTTPESTEKLEARNKRIMHTTISQCKNQTIVTSPGNFRNI